MFSRESPKSQTNAIMKIGAITTESFWKVMYKPKAAEVSPFGDFSLIKLSAITQKLDAMPWKINAIKSKSKANSEATKTTKK